MKAQMLCHAHMEQSRISCLGPFCEWILVSPMFFLKACRFLKDAVATFFKGLLCLISCPYLAYYWFGIALTKYMLVVLSIRVLFNFRGDISPCELPECIVRSQGARTQTMPISWRLGHTKEASAVVRSPSSYGRNTVHPCTWSKWPSQNM